MAKGVTLRAITFGGLAGKAALLLGYVNPDQLKKCIAILEKQAARGNKLTMYDVFAKQKLMKNDRINRVGDVRALIQSKRNMALFGRLAVMNKILTQEQLNEVLTKKQAMPGRRIGEICVDMGLMSQEQADTLFEKQKQMKDDSDPDDLAGKDQILEFPADLAEITVGREQSNTIAISDKKVSRAHCKIMKQDGRWYIQDLDSLYGIFVNGREILGTSIEDGDRILIGDTLFIACLPATSSQPQQKKAANWVYSDQRRAPVFAEEGHNFWSYALALVATVAIFGGIYYYIQSWDEKQAAATAAARKKPAKDIKPVNVPSFTYNKIMEDVPKPEFKNNVQPTVTPKREIPAEVVPEVPKTVEKPTEPDVTDKVEFLAKQINADSPRVDRERVYRQLEALGPAGTRKVQELSMARYAEVTGLILASPMKSQIDSIMALRLQLFERRVEAVLMIQDWNKYTEKSGQAQVSKLVEKVQAVYAQQSPVLPALDGENLELYSEFCNLQGRIGASLPKDCEYFFKLLELARKRALTFKNLPLECEWFGMTEYNEQVVQYNERFRGKLKKEEFDCVDAVNQYRIMMGRHALKISQSLSTSARGHSEEMGKLKYLNGFSPNAENRSPLSRSRKLDYSGQFVGESVCKGSPVGKDVVNALAKNSADHRNLLMLGYVDVGIGFANGCWTIDLGPAPDVQIDRSNPPKQPAAVPTGSKPGSQSGGIGVGTTGGSSGGGGMGVGAGGSSGGTTGGSGSGSGGTTPGTNREGKTDKGDTKGPQDHLDNIDKGGGIGPNRGPG